MNKLEVAHQIQATSERLAQEIHNFCVHVGRKNCLMIDAARWDCHDALDLYLDKLNEAYKPNA